MILTAAMFAIRVSSSSCSSLYPVVASWLSTYNTPSTRSLSNNGTAIAEWNLPIYLELPER